MGNEPKTYESFDEALASGENRLYVKGLLHDTLAKASVLLGETGRRSRKDEVVKHLKEARSYYRQAGLYEDRFQLLKARVERAIQDPNNLISPNEVPW